MKVKAEVTVVGARMFNDSVEGQTYDFTKIRVMMPVPDAADNQCGFDVIDMPFGSHKEFDKLKDLNYPVKAELDLVATSKGYECQGFKPLVAQVKQAQAAQG